MRNATKRLKKNREATKTAANISTGTTTSHFPSPRAIHTSNAPETAATSPTAVAAAATVRIFSLTAYALT